MGNYLGFIEKKGSEPVIYFNFKPIAEIYNNSINVLTVSEQDALLPESDKNDINFFYSFNSTEQRKIMDNYFHDKSLALFEFELADLSANYKVNGERNQTGYKVDAIDMIDKQKIRTINTDGVYQVIEKKSILADFYKDAIV